MIKECEVENVENSTEISGLCIGSHIGRTPCTKKQGRKSSASKEPKESRETIIHFASFGEKSTSGTLEKSIEKSQYDQILEMNRKLMERQS